MSAETLPVVKARRRGYDKVILDCCFCGGSHIHGAEGLPGPRTSHCSDPKLGGTYQVEL